MDYRFSVRKKDNGWQLILRYKDANGKWKQKAKQGFSKKSLALAESEKQELLSYINKYASVNQDYRDLTLKEFSLMYTEDRKHELAYNTLKGYKNIIKRYPGLVNKRVCDIEKTDFLVIYRDEESSSAAKNLYISLLKSLLRHARDVYHIINDDFFSDLHPVKNKSKKTITSFTNEELEYLLTCLKSASLEAYMMCLLACKAGLRYGEVMALTSSDIDNGIIHVTRQYGKISDDTSGFKPLKSANSKRDVPISSFLATAIKDYISIIGKKPSDRLFTMSNTRINYIVKKYIPNGSYHRLRHTYATTLLANGMDVKTVSALIGDTVQTVINTYIHYTNDMRIKAAQDIEKIFG